ncbi:hypothetical protein C8A01DRAFT_40734 [Parachaetomium inaequale]|uniref:Uncharacterized protein n=1 Tax=Parachaetomium inaequale TaxID=2588326 RepID=A0AAN6PBA1_9PEZI|nr:hypothetical protein C8A01DRAFT_40734 [Parachaetomium inaequale]
MSAVKNLRAMFEQKGETSPPDRGRSPGIPHGAGSDSPRPLSKIRTSFVAIEKDGRMGIQREGSQDSISALRKHSGDSNVSTPTTGTERSNPFDASTKSPAKMVLQTQPIPDSPRSNPSGKDVLLPALAVQAAKPASPPVAATETVPKKIEANGSEEEASSASAAVPQVGTPNGAGSVKEPQKPAAKETSKPATRTPKPTPKPLAVAPASKSTTKPEKSPRGPRTPAATSTHHAVAKKTPERKAHPPEKPSTPRATPASKSAGPSSIKKPPPLQSSPASTGFVKPKVKSPTRPVKLPPGLTTHTASSGSKVNAPRQSLSRASGSTLPADALGRPASRASGSTAGSASNKAAPVRGLRRQSSTINRPRPSLGPPPKQPAKDHPPTKREKEVDQGFLARMMRPTAASASKTTGRVHTSPPRKLAAAPKKVATAKPVKKAVSKPTATASDLALHKLIFPTEAGERSPPQPVAHASEEAYAAAMARDEAALPPPSPVSDDHQPAENPGPLPWVAVAGPAVTDAERAEAVAAEDKEAASPQEATSPREAASAEEDAETAAAEAEGDAPETAAA